MCYLQKLHNNTHKLLRSIKKIDLIKYFSDDFQLNMTKKRLVAVPIACLRIIIDKFLYVIGLIKNL